MGATILHISDLHRDSQSGISTQTLIESLRLDHERYRAAGVAPSPDIAVVSGDIVFGVKDRDSDAEIERQYQEAHDFLAALADQFLGGNRERIVIVPGNHDVSHPHVLRALEPVTLPTEPEKRELLARQLQADGSSLRWVASEFAVRRVADQNAYAQRFEPYARFYSKFYEGKRTFPIEAKRQVVVHAFSDLELVVVGLSSCCENDLFNRSGKVHPDCIAAATREISDYVRRGFVAAAVWHHNLAGGPNDHDYVDAEIVQSLMDGGFVIGLHGHQHRPQFLEHRFTADRKRSIAVISAGTLCAGPSHLPPGRMRAYNLVCVDSVARSGSVHVRDMKNISFGSPVWGDAYVNEFAGATMKFELAAPLSPVSAISKAADAEEALRKGDAREAYSLVRQSLSDGFARRVALQSLTALGDWEEIVRVFNPPTSALEFITLCEALYANAWRDELRRLLESDYARDSKDPAVRQCIEQARGRLRDR